MAVPRWRGIEQELTPRSVRLLIIAVLLGFGSASNGFAPARPQLTLASALLHGDSARSDSLMRLIGIPEVVRAPRSLTRGSYRRSSQVQHSLDELRERELLLPLPGLRAAALQDTFDDVRGDGTRRHNAIDHHAPRGTP